jgi:hypothetical protein
MSLTFINHRGEAWNPSAEAMKTKKAAPKDKPESFHRGFSVEGHPPGALERARAYAMKARADWSAMTEEKKAAELRSGRREPQPWSEEVWRAKTKPTKVRARPYGVEAAAKECASLAERQGWIDVRVVELKKGEAEEGAL